MLNRNITSIIVATALLFLYIPSSLSQYNFSVTQSGYLSSKGVSILAYHNNYFVGKQGGIEIIQNDKRVASNGMVVFRLKDDANKGGTPEYFSEPIPKTKPIKPLKGTDNKSIHIPIKEDIADFEYNTIIQGYDTAVVIYVDFIDFPSNDIISDVYFDIELSPSYYRGKSVIFDNSSQIVPLNFHHAVSTQGYVEPEPIGSGKHMVLAPESPKVKLDIQAINGTLELLDTRHATDHNWYTLRAKINTKSMDDGKFALVIKPSVDKNYSKTPVLGYSQMGYHPNQNKVIVIEADTNYTNDQAIDLLMFNQEKGEFEVILNKKPQYWGKYNRYDIYTFDFTEIKKDGLYYVSLKDKATTNPFRIAETVYHDGIWQPVLQTFIPVQMCHMRVKDRNRIWHGACHLDDAMQAPTPLKFLDGFTQGCEETKYKPYETIPGLNHGGWHDAGDDDINNNSTGRTAYHLALITEEFGVDLDQTTIDFENREVFLHRPDGKSDFIQNIKHGLNFIIPQYEALGHGIVGVVSSSYETYFIPGTWADMTDQLFYDSTLQKGERTSTHSAKADDRFAFTNKDTRAEFRNAWVLAAITRALQIAGDSLAVQTLELAENIWSKEINAIPVFHSSVGTPSYLEEEKLLAAVELFLTTKKEIYLSYIKNNLDYALNNMEKSAWAIARVSNSLPSKAKKKFDSRLVEYNDSLSSAFAKNPYGTYLDATLWGYGWDILWRTYKHYYLVKHYPEIFSPDPIINCNEFLLGKHQYSSVSYVSGVGTSLPIPAFGMNRSDYYYIPGGVFSGVNKIEPDFPELLEDHPFIWQQSEYIIHGASPFIFTILAADKLLNTSKKPYNE